MTLKSLSEFVDKARERSGRKIALVAAEDEPALGAVADALKENIAEPVLIGCKEKILKIAGELNFDVSKVEIIEENNPAKSAKIGVELIREGSAHILMKGSVPTADFLRAILDKENGLRTGSLLSHIGFFETKFYHKLIALTDAAQNIAPELAEKVGIINNAVDLFHRLGVERPKVAALAAVEKVNPKMPASIDAALLAAMNRRKQIKGCVIDGPLALDNAISAEAANHKGIESEVAGDADLLFAPNIESANMLYKSLTYFAGAAVGAIILGAAAPIALTSRADTPQSKLTSIALAASC